MARNKKQGVDYFPLDVHIDNKLKFIKIKHGIEGYGVIICLLQHIYSQSFYCEWSEDDMLLFADEIKVDHVKLNEIVNYAIDRKFFDQELYQEHKILTSTGIQKRYKEIVRRRKEVEIESNYLLIDGDFGIIVDIKENNVVPKPAEEKPIVPIVPKVAKIPKEPKKDEVIEAIKEYTENDQVIEALKEFRKMRVKIKKPPTARAMKGIFKKLNEFSKGDDAIKIQLLDQAILHNWQDIYELKKQGSNNSTSNTYTKSKNKFNDFEQHETKSNSAIQEMLAKKAAARKESEGA